MQIRAGILIVAAATMLGGCEFRAKGRDAAADDAAPASANRSVEKGLAISTPGFEGKVNIPGMTLGGDAMDLDGMKLPPGSKVTGISIEGKSRGEDRIRIAFTSDAPPQALLEHFRAEGRNAGFAVAAPAAALDVRGTKASGKSFVLTAAPAGTGAAGTLLLVDDDGD